MAIYLSGSLVSAGIIIWIDKTWQEKARDQQALKAAATKIEPEAEYNDDTRSVFIDLTFTIAAVHTMAQAYSFFANMSMATSTIP